MRESTIETRLVRACKDRDVQCYKFVSPSNRGVPDRLIISPFGRVGFIEMKAPGKDLSALQKHTFRKLRERNVPAWVVDSAEGIKLALDDFLKI